MGQTRLLAYPTKILLSVFPHRCASLKRLQTLSGLRSRAGRVMKILRILLLPQWKSGTTNDDQSIEHRDALLQDVPQRQSLMKKVRSLSGRALDHRSTPPNNRSHHGNATGWPPFGMTSQHSIWSNGMGRGAGQGEVAAAARTTTVFWRRKRTSSRATNESTCARLGGSVRRRKLTSVSPEALNLGEYQ